MNTAKRKLRFLAGVLVFTLAFVLGAGVTAIPAYAASGNVYTCKVVPCYQHPVTGVIEDSGGEASYATGQGMVESAVGTTGIMEVTSDGKYYLTIRMSLMDYTSGHSFWVQNVGDSNWSSPALGVTGNGSDSNGTTTDICIQVPSENCVVRGAMYVEPMGRDVIFYFYPTNYTEGNSTNMNSTMITADTTVQSSGTTSANGGTTSTTSGSSSLSSSTETTDTEEEEATETGEAEDSGLQSSLGDEVEPVLNSDTDTSLNSAQGLSLSTAEDAEAEDKETSDISVGQWIFIITISVLIVGFILMGAGAGIVYYFRKNWYRWGGGEDDEE